MPGTKGRDLGIQVALCVWVAGAPHLAHPLFVSVPSPHPSQAIRELQEEVSLLRLRLEDSLHQPPQGSLVCPASTFNRPARARARPTDSSAAWGSHYGRWVTPKRLPLCPGGVADLAAPGSLQTCELTPLSDSYTFFLCNI